MVEEKNNENIMLSWGRGSILILFSGEAEKSDKKSYYQKYHIMLSWGRRGESRVKFVNRQVITSILSYHYVGGDHY